MTAVITLPHFFPGEAAGICNLLVQGKADIIHIRKPGSTESEVEDLVRKVIIRCEEAGGRLVLHDHHSLAVKYNLHGIHLNSRNPLPPTGWKGSVSRSCHTLYEVVEWKPLCDYVSLSPIFDSLSKEGYHSAFSAEEIARAKASGIIDSKVFALGGITFKRIPEVLQMGFGGAMILGDAWKDKSKINTQII